MPKSDTAAYRGKKPEAAVKAYLEGLSSKTASFDWERKYDAHSAGGRFQRQIYDFAFFMPGVHGGIEVKEIAHDYRIPYKNFKPEQVAGLRKRRLAGGYVIVLVYHSTSGLWRAPGLDVFLERPEDSGSWDLRGHATFESCRDALNFTMP